MIIFDELAYAEKMSKQGFIKCFSIYELSIYAKWLKYQDKPNEEIESLLIKFSKEWNKDFTYDVDYPKIDGALKSINEYSLRTTIPTKITENEWKIILSLDNEKYRRVLFIMLVISKYYKNNNTKIVTEIKDIGSENKYADKYFCNFSDIDIINLSGVRFKDKSLRDKMFNYFYDKNLIDITMGKKSIRIVNIVNNDGDELASITDYDNIILYYEKLIGEKIGECKECHKLFRQKENNNASYCYQHRKYQKVKNKTIKCIDCGEEFEVAASNMTKIRCNECQKVINREKTRLRVQKHRNNQDK